MTTKSLTSLINFSVILSINIISIHVHIHHLCIVTNNENTFMT